MTLGANIKMRREQLGMGTVDLARAAGVDKGTISALEIRGSERSKFLPEIARALKCTSEQLVSGDFPPIGSAPASHGGPMGGAPPLPPRNFDDRMEVSPSDWGLLKDIELMMTPEQIADLRKKAAHARKMMAIQGPLGGKS